MPSFRDYFELNEFILGTHKTQDTHANVNKEYEIHQKDINIDNILMRIVKKITQDNKEIHILHRDNNYSKKHHELSGVEPRQDSITDIGTLPLKYFHYNSNDTTQKREFKFEISDYYIKKGKDKLKSLVQKIRSLIEGMFKKLGFFTAVTIKHDDEIMNVNVVLSHHTHNLDFKSFMKHI